ncbi:MAG: hypothetical protein KAS72_02740 [Phycisphaerales bacterium]|nr:hypothetical protein [Phycisphaerales bacterium]
MGLVLQAGHPNEIYGDEYGPQVAGVLKDKLGDAVPLGTPNECFDSFDGLGGELAWGWWSELQQLAEETLGEDATPHLTRVDAWEGVYVDVRSEPTLVWPKGEGEEPQQPAVSVTIAPEPTLVGRILQRLGLRGRGLPADAQAMMQAMAAEFGPREGERGALQVGDLRALREELAKLAEALGHQANDEAMLTLAREYSADDDRCDDDGGVQCLTHAWITSSKALELNAPMWVVK